MNVRKKRMLQNKDQKPTCANCFACRKGSEYCHLTKNNDKEENQVKTNPLRRGLQ